MEDRVNVAACPALCVSMRRRIALLLALAVGLGACTFGKRSDRDGFRPTYQPVVCPAEIATIMLTEVSCGTLTVLAHHGEPDRGKLRLFVTRIQPGTSQPAPTRRCRLAATWAWRPTRDPRHPGPRGLAARCWMSAGRAGPNLTWSARSRRAPVVADERASRRPTNPQ